MEKIVPIDPLEDPRWREYISENGAATIFHHPDWIGVLEAAYEYRPCCFAAVEGTQVEGLLPAMEVRSWLTGRRAVCLPFSDACAPLYRRPEVMELFISHCEHVLHARGWDYVEFRGLQNHPGLPEHARFKRHTLHLSAGSHAVFRTFKKTQIQQRITKSLREGVVVERGQSESHLRHFMWLNALTRKKLGVPPQPERFFLALLERLIMKNFGFISLAKHGEHTIAAGVFLHFGRTVIFKYSCSDEAFLRFRPNHLILWDAIQWACEQGYRELDFGRTDLEDEGLLEYKRGWGTVESDLIYHRLAGRRAVRTRATAAGMARLRPILKRLPVSVLKTLGGYLYEHVG